MCFMKRVVPSEVLYQTGDWHASIWSTSACPVMSEDVAIVTLIPPIRQTFVSCVERFNSFSSTISALGRMLRIAKGLQVSQ